MPEITSDMISYQQNVSEIIYDYPELILVLERLNIFPGFGDKTIEEIAKEKEIDADLLMVLLRMQLDPEHSPNIDLPVSTIQPIVEYLSVSHDYYTRELYPVIAENIALLAEKNNHTSIQMVKQFFAEYRNEADRHFEYENDIAFPYILSLYLENQKLPDEISAEYSVDTYRENHDNIEEKLDDLKQLLIKYLPFDEDYRIRRNIILTLDRLDADIKAHAKIEDEILIPLVRQLEEKLTK